MSFSAFENLSEQRPEISPALEAIQGWLRAHSGSKAIEPSRVVKTMHVDPWLVAEAFGALVNVGALRRAYRVRPPHSNTFTAEIFRNYQDIPSELEDSYQNRFSVDEAEVVTVYELLEADVR